MGLLINGVWHDQWYDTAASEGRFVRTAAQFHDRVSADGATGYKAEPGRYRLIVCAACPWSHRTTIARVVKNLTGVVALTAVDALMAERGWVLPDGTPLYEYYRAARPGYSGRVTVPVLWDDRTGRIVSNESGEIVRMFDSAFRDWADPAAALYPEEMREPIDALNADLYERVNNGVYRAGFATTQAAYEEAFDAVFAAFDELEARLGSSRYLFGERVVETDWRLFVTLVRFDAVYHGHFKCNLRRLVDYPQLWRYTRELYRLPGIAATVELDTIKRHYYASHRTINPTGIIPKGPDIRFD